MSPKLSSKRRTFLQQVALTIGGVLGIRSARATEPVQVHGPLPSVWRLQLRCCQKSPMPPGKSKASSDRVVCQGELVDPNTQKAEGAFYANCFSAESAFGLPNPSSGSDIELHTLKLKGGTLFGMGTPIDPQATSENAILGGTGQFAGARGTYQIVHGDKSTNRAGEVVIQLLQ